MYKKVLCGLDIGTNSVGWCLMNEENKIIRKNGKSLWGVRMFDEADDCSERRGYRSSRRRLHRRKERIMLLRELLNDEIQKVDSTFFRRLDNSFYIKEDREIEFDYTLFNDIHYSDKMFYKEYPTIYHLRKKLIDSDKKEDIRFIYLALHHMIKYRGNFLSEQKEFSPMNPEERKKLFKELKEKIEQIESDEEKHYLEYIDDKFKEIKKEILNAVGIKNTEEIYNKYLNKEKNKKIADIIKFMAGGKLKIASLFSLNEKEDFGEDDVKEIRVTDADFDDKIEKLLSKFGSTNYEILIDIMGVCRKIYQYFLLGKLLGDDKYLSYAMVRQYEKHHKQLKELKDYVRKNCKEKYAKIFRTLGTNINNYPRYIGSTIVGNKKQSGSHCSQEDFYKFLKTELGITDKCMDSFLIDVKNEMEKNQYLSRMNSTDNGVFPYQLNLMEMQIILEKQGKHYPYLLEIKEKIISLLTFKIPYYVGPLIDFEDGNERSKFAWVKKTKEKIYPWNFDKVVDLDQSAENFIKRMLTKCTYLPSEYCLPKNSLLFSYFNVLQVLNKTFINGDYMDYDRKMDVINNLFKKQRKVTNKDFCEYMKSKHGEDVKITTSTGKEIEKIQYDLSSYVDFVNIFGKEYVDNNLDLIENIILDIVIFEDKTILEKRLQKKFPHITSQQLKSIKALTYSKWGSISKKLLDGIYYTEPNGEVKTIIRIMEETNQNLQEIIYSEEYHFVDKIDEYNKENLGKEKIDSIEEYVKELGTVSPGMKRPLIQAYKICEELEKIVGQPIDEYYVECTREHLKGKAKQRKDSRYESLKKLYEEANNILIDKELKDKLDRYKDKLQSDKYYLYFTQLGKSMYTGNPIDFDSLSSNELYDIDHIIPQSLVKDDSLSNRVLVEKNINNRKQDIYPIPQETLFKGDYKKAYAFYKVLEESKLISKEKYARLTRIQPLKEQELEAFVNRQLVYTNQAVKGFIEAIKYFKVTETFKPKIIYSKAENVSSFRKECDIYKSRSANNFHHAHDAYLNVYIGRAIDSYFKPFQNKQSVLRWMKENSYTTNAQRALLPKNPSNHKPIKDEKGNIVWNYDQSIKEIKKNIFHRFDILTTTRTYVSNELFGKVTILPKGKGNIGVKTKGPLSDTEKYGGLKQYAFGSYALVKYKDDVILEAIPTIYQPRLLDKSKLQNQIDLSKFNDYFRNIKSWNEYEILVPQLKINTVIAKDKKKFIITGKTGNQYVVMNNIERIFKDKHIKIIHDIDKLIDIITKKKMPITGDEAIEKINKCGFICDENRIVIAPAKNENNREIILTNEDLLDMYHIYISMYNKDIYSYSAMISLANKLEEKEDVFKNLSYFGKVKVLSELNKLLKCNERKSADLSLIGLTKNEAVLYFSNKLKNCKLIAESITGFYRKTLYEIN